MADRTPGRSQPPTRTGSYSRRRTVGPPSWSTLPGPERGSLATVTAGDVVRVTEIFFQIVRNRCWELGIHEGDVLECLAVEDEAVLFRHSRRNVVCLERSCARFVQAGPLDGSPALGSNPAPGVGEMRPSA